VFPRYRQLDSVLKLVAHDARRRCPATIPDPALCLQRQDHSNLVAVAPAATCTRSGHKSLDGVIVLPTVACSMTLQDVGLSYRARARGREGDRSGFEVTGRGALIDGTKL